MKNLTVLLIFLYIFFGLSCSAFADTKCNKEAGYTEIKDSKCYNPTTLLSYERYKPSRFYYNDKYCGSKCDYEGRNCSDGICNPSDCAQSYTFKLINDMQYMCYNPEFSLSYTKNNYLGEMDFYYNGKYCGKDCDFEGKNCHHSGICNPTDCAKGYTFKEINSKLMCYNPKLSLSYTKDYDYTHFYYDGFLCGKNCDFEGRNCREGICNPSNCAKGYTEMKDGKCYNPKLLLSYKKYYNSMHFYRNGFLCGKNCDFDGKNCTEGNCNTSNCAKGYTEMKDGKCYNPQTLLSYDKKDFYYFYYDGFLCGKNCDFDGKNCTEGICNVSNCDNGYIQLKRTEFKESTFPVYKPIEKQGILVKNPGFFDTVELFKHNSTISTKNKESYACYNPDLNIAYLYSWDRNYYGKTFKVFSVDNEVCGINCDDKGKNCEVGLCNVESCPKGYKILYHGACKSEKGNKILVYVSNDKLVKFHHPTTITIQEKLKDTSDNILFLGFIFFGLITYPIVMLFQ